MTSDPPKKSSLKSHYPSKSGHFSQSVQLCHTHSNETLSFEQKSVKRHISFARKQSHARWFSFYNEPTSWRRVTNPVCKLCIWHGQSWKFHVVMVLHRQFLGNINMLQTRTSTPCKKVPVTKHTLFIHQNKQEEQTHAYPYLSCC